MLKISSVSIIYYAFLQTFTAIFQSIGKAHLPFLTLLISLFARIILTVVLVRINNINIFGAIIAQSVFLSLATIILAISLRKYIDLEYKTIWMLVNPLLIGGISMTLMYFVHLGLSLIINYFISMIISAIIGVCIFVILVYYGKVFNEKEKKQFFMRKKKLTKG